MSPVYRSYFLLIAGSLVILGSVVFGGLSTTIAVAAAVALFTAVVAVSFVWRSGTPAQPMRQLLYDLDPHESSTAPKGR